MLIRFIVSNFMSFKEETEFNMLPASGQKRLKEHIYSAGGVDVLKMAAIYGANGAGKSNLTYAVSAMKDIILKSDFSAITKFKLDKANATKPTKFEIEFSVEDKVYSYGLTIDINSITGEWLYQTGVKNDKLIFDRSTKNSITKIEMSEEYSNTPEGKLRIKLYETEFLKDNLCLLSVMANAKDSFMELKKVFSFFKVDLIVSNDIDTNKYINFLLYTNPKLTNFVSDSLQNINSGINKLDFESKDVELYFKQHEQNKIADTLSKLSKHKGGVILDTVFSAFYPPYAIIENGSPQIKTLVSVHKDNDNEDIAFDLHEESDGTQMLIEILPWLFSIIHFPYILIIDEIEESIHVNLLKELVSKFSKDNNTKGQLIFTTHESNLLDQDILRQDEIWFAEKSPTGETGFYPLSDYDIRSDLDIRKGYLNGRFGAVPFLANLHDLNWDKYAKEEV